MFPQGTIYAGYEIIDGQGKNGSYGLVYKALHNRTKEQIALKFSMFPGDPLLYKRFKNENTILHKLKPHPNIVTPASHVTHDGNNAFYSMEFLELDLDIVIANLKTGDVPEKLELFKQICKGLAHSHSKGIFHRDLNPENVRFSKDVTTVAKLTDFGLGKIEAGYFKSTNALKAWGQGVKPPEVAFFISDNPTSEQYAKGDIFALGILLCLMFSAESSIINYIGEMRMGLGAQIQKAAVSYPDEYILRTESTRNNDYEDWLKNANIQSKLEILLPNVDMGKKLSTIVQKMCNIDYRRRYSSVNDVISAIEGL